MKNQLEDIISVLANYRGALIFAGDFNTWNEARDEVLQKAAQKLGVEEIPFERKKEGKVLDHVFQRGCLLEKSWVLNDVDSSDHDPEFVDLNCNN